jgi:hypothetical protein
MAKMRRLKPSFLYDEGLADLHFDDLRILYRPCNSRMGAR